MPIAGAAPASRAAVGSQPDFGGKGTLFASRREQLEAGSGVLVMLAAIVAVVAFVVLFRLFWLSAKPNPATGVITLVVLMLIAALGLLAATGRLHWLAALGAALLPFLRRSLGLLRYVPFLGRMYAQYRRQHTGQEQARGAGAAASAMTREQALAVLGLEANPTRQPVALWGKSTRTRGVQPTSLNNSTKRNGCCCATPEAIGDKPAGTGLRSRLADAG